MLFLRFKRYLRKIFCYQDQYDLQAIVLCLVILCYYLILPAFLSLLDNDYLAVGIVYCVSTRWLALLVVCWEAIPIIQKIMLSIVLLCMHITLPKFS